MKALLASEWWVFLFLPFHTNVSTFSAYDPGQYLFSVASSSDTKYYITVIDGASTHPAIFPVK